MISRKSIQLNAEKSNADMNRDIDNSEDSSELQIIDTKMEDDKKKHEDKHIYNQPKHINK